jgi:hypothetical protein
MKAASRSTLVLAALIALFVLGVALALGGLLAVQDPGAGVVFAVATLAGLLAAAITYCVARTVDLDDDAEPVPARHVGPQELAPVSGPLRIERLPVATLPAPYVAAVMKGLQANRQALSRGTGAAGKQARC